MGGRNVNRALIYWRGRLQDRPLLVLVYMALVSLDKDQPPIYFGGWEAIATNALGYAAPDSNAMRSVKRQIQNLSDAGAIDLTNSPRTGVRAEYHLNLDPAEGDTQRPPRGGQPVTPSGKGEGDTQRPPEGVTQWSDSYHSVADQGVTQRPPKERRQEPQDLHTGATSPAVTTVTGRCAHCGGRMTSDGDCLAHCEAS